MTDRETVYLRLTRPEGYENVHPDLILEDFMDGNGLAFLPEVVDDLAARLEAAERERDEARAERDAARAAVVELKGQLRRTQDRLIYAVESREARP